MILLYIQYMLLTTTAVRSALLSRLPQQEVVCLKSADAAVLVLTLQLRLMPESGIVTQNLSNSDANLQIWCCDTYQIIMAVSCTLAHMIMLHGKCEA